MPRKKTVITTETGPVDLTNNFTVTGAGSDFTYSDSSNLRILIRFPNDGSGRPTNNATFASSHSLAVTYASSATVPDDVNITSNLIGARSGIDAFLAEDVANTQTLLTFSGTDPHDNIITFGNGSSDSAFSVSFWVKLSSSYSASGARGLFGKGKTGDATDSEYFLSYKPSSAGVNPNSLQLQLRDDSNSQIIQRLVDGINLEDDNWHHIAVTYNGAGGANVENEMKFYMDGVEKTNTVAATNNTSGYVAMEPTSEEFHIGAAVDGNTEIDGFMAEFAVWGAELSSNSVKAIYHAQSDVTNETNSFNSGYTNLSPRIQQRAMDNRPGCYPTKHRMGDKDRSGKSNIFYEDLPIKFGACIKDDFEDIDTPGGFAGENKFDKNKWVVSSGMSIRTERVPGDGVTLIDKCAVFSGVGDGGKRFIRSANKIINPIRFYFEIIQGPYNNTTGGLDLRAIATGTATGIKVQISTDAAFTSPINISTIQLNSNRRQFFGIDDNDAEELSKPRKRVYLDLKDFAGLTEPYYFRFVQESYDVNKNNWAISKIEVDYANQSVRAPLLLNHGSGNEKFVSASLTTPHTDSDLLVTGRSVSGISDVVNPFQDFTETVTPFNETLAVENNDSGFFNEGLDTDVYPGFTSPTRSKTKFTFDLSPSEETTFGVTNQGTANGAGQAPGDDTTGTGQNYMVYWNKDLNRWEPIGLQPTPTTLHGGNVSPALSLENYKKFVMNKAALGFGPIKAIFRETSAGVFSVVEDEVAASYSKPINSFLFPFGNQYVASASNYVLAEDLGISKPFLLEKLAIDFQAKLQFPGTADNQSAFGEHANAYSGSYLNTSNNLTRLSGRSARKISFFLLRQFDDEKEIDHVLSVSPASEIKTSYNISGSSRELISYGQLGVFLTGSDYNNLNTPTIDKILDSPLSGDNNLVIENWNQLALTSVTGSYSLNFKSRNTARFKSGASFLLKVSGYPLLQKNNVGRGDGSLTSNSRAIVNGLNGEGESVEINADATIGPTAHTKTEFIDLDSPYLINPKDKLIFGWQYPPAYNLKGSLPIVGDSGFSNMTLFGKSKLHLYGSQVVENKEFHETVNQNLTSCGVYEHIIGDEKVVDQWQVAYRGELSGSIAGQSIFNYNSAFDNGNSETWNFAFNNDWTLDSISNSAYTNVKVHEILNKSHPKKRIGSRIVQGGRSTIFKLWKSAGQSDEDANSAAAAYSEYLVPIRLYITTRDQDRVYLDSNVVFGELFNQSTYGGINAQAVNINNLQKHPFFLSAQANTSFYAGTKPQYIFKSDHFGYYADMLRQGLDSKFEVTPRQGFTTGYDIVVNSESPVRVKFVSGTTQEGPTLRAYTEKNVDLYLDEKIFQSSNLSTTATSSIPFIDDNQPRNRNYIETEFIAVPLF